MFYPRKILNELENHIPKRQITLLTGIRRSGKTTLIKHILSSKIKSKNKVYLDLERLDIRELFAEKNYENIVISLTNRGIDFSQKAYIALDEIQLLPSIASPIKYLYDNYKIKFILTGSSSYYLKNLFPESLAGRKKIFELYPLDFSEFLEFNKCFYRTLPIDTIRYDPSEYERLKQHYELYLRFGGFPEVVLAKTNRDKKDLLNDIVSSYISIDIKTLADFKNEHNIYNLIKLLAKRAGTRLDYSKLSRTSGLSRPTVNNYIDLFEKTYLLTRIPVYTKSPDREIVKAKKLYFCDNGLLNTLAKVDGGTEFENAIFNQLRPLGKLQYYAKKTGLEIDFILNKKAAIEVKESPTISHIKKLSILAKAISLKKTYIIGKKPTLERNEKFIWGGSIH
jgi:uncharacterized protein